jgi:hypothetical protein
MRNVIARWLGSVACVVCLLLCRSAVGQQNSPEQPAPPQAALAPLPNAPSATPATGPIDENQPKRILGVMPNFRTVSAGQVLPKETLHDKLVTSTLDNFDYTSLFFASAIAGISFGTRATPEFHQGAAGYGRYYWHTVADQSIENYFVELIVPAATHEDSRYYAMGKEDGSVWKRAGYSLSRVLITRTDSGEATFNISEISGSAAAASVSSFYYPSKERTVGNDLRNWGLDITYDSATFLFHEFWPDISHRIFRGKHSGALATP